MRSPGSSSPPVTSLQTEPHPRLVETVLKHARHPWLRPVAEHNRRAFHELEAVVNRWSGPLVLDTGCGTGLSTQVLARRFPDALVLGLDKSQSRLDRHVDGDARNYLLKRLDLEDFWPLAKAAGWRFAFQAFYYPNPWPKAEHRLRRWPLHPVFPLAVETGGTWELRTNWEVYAAEMALAFEVLTGVRQPVEAWNPPEPETLFERKYLASGHQLFRWTATVADVPTGAVAAARRSPPAG